MGHANTANSANSYHGAGRVYTARGTSLPNIFNPFSAMKRSPKRVKRGFVPPLDAGQLARLGPDGTIALAARCLLRSAPFAVENLRKKRPDAALLLARVLHAISGCGLSIATKGTARSFQSKFQLAQLASSIRSGVSTLESVVAPGGAEALTAGRLILAACKAMLEKRQNGYELAVQSITHALGVLDLDPAKVVDKGILATAQDFAFLHKAAAESHDPKKYI